MLQDAHIDFRRWRALWRGELAEGYRISKMKLCIPKKPMEKPGIDPGTFRMRSERATTCATSPDVACMSNADLHGT